MSYRLQGKSFLLTWSQVTHGWAELNDTIFNNVELILNEQGPVGLPSPHRGLIALENHKDGGDHVHAYIEFDTKIDQRLTDQWNYGGRRPNVKSKRTKKERLTAHNYLLKDGIFKYFGDWLAWEESVQTGSGQVQQESVNLSEAAQTATNFASYIQFCFENSVPFGYCQAAWQAARQPDLTITEDDDGGEISSDQLRFMRFDVETTRALVIIGPTGCGKTVWARNNAPRPALFVRHLDDLKQFKVGYHVSIIFDDMNFAGDEVTGKGAWPRTSQIHLVDFNCNSSIHTRYSTAFIPAKTHKIFTGNSYMFTMDSAIERRVYLINL